MSDKNSQNEENHQQEESDYNQNELKENKKDEPKENFSEEKYKENKIILVKNMPFNITDFQLKEFFSKFANVEKAYIKKIENEVGFVEFGTVEEKRNVLMMDRDELIIEGRRLDIKDLIVDGIDLCKSIFVGNLSYSTNEEKIKKFFIDNIQDLKGDFKVNIQTTYNGKSKGYAYIEFENEEDISNILKINGKKLDDRVLTIKMRKSRRLEGSVGRGRFQGSGIRMRLGNRSFNHEKDNYFRDTKRSRSRSISNERIKNKNMDRNREREIDRRRYKEDRYKNIVDRNKEKERYKGGRDKNRDRERDKGKRERARYNRERRYK